MEVFVEAFVGNDRDTGFLKSFNIPGMVLMNVRHERVFHWLRRDRFDLSEKIVIKLLTQVLRVDEEDALICHANRGVAAAVDNHVDAWLDLFDRLGSRRLRAAATLCAARITAATLCAARITAALTAGRPLAPRRRLLTLRTLGHRNERCRCQRDSHRNKDRDPFSLRHLSS